MRYLISPADASYPRIAELFTSESVGYYREKCGVEIEISNRGATRCGEVNLVLVDRRQSGDVKTVSAPFVALSTTDSTAFLGREKRFIQSEYCQRWIAASVYREGCKGWYFEPVQWGQEPTLNAVARAWPEEFSGAFFESEDRIREESPMRLVDVEKVRLGLPIYPYSRVKKHLYHARDFTDREVDVAFLGTTEYGYLDSGDPAPVMVHREKCIEVIESLDAMYQVVAGGEWVDKDYYFATLANTRIVVSPWGRGAWCWRDFEAVAAGCVVIKPETKHVEVLPDLYNPLLKSIYFCEPDFSNLSAVVARVMAQDWSGLDHFHSFELPKWYQDETSFPVIQDRFIEALTG